MTPFAIYILALKLYTTEHTVLPFCWLYNIFLLTNFDENICLIHQGCSYTLYTHKYLCILYMQLYVNIYAFCVWLQGKSIKTMQTHPLRDFIRDEHNFSVMASVSVRETLGRQSWVCEWWQWKFGKGYALWMQMCQLVQSHRLLVIGPPLSSVFTWPFHFHWSNKWEGWSCIQIQWRYVERRRPILSSTNWNFSSEINKIQLQISIDVNDPSITL